MSFCEGSFSTITNLPQKTEGSVQSVPRLTLSACVKAQQVLFRMHYSPYKNHVRQASFLPPPPRITDGGLTLRKQLA